MSDFALLIKQPPHLGDGTSFDQLGDNTERYEHTTVLIGGYWTAQWEMPLKGKNTEDYLRHFFNNYLGCAVQEWTAAGLTWEGLIQWMELTLSGLTKRLDRETINNALRVQGTDPEGNHFDTADSEALTIDERGYYSGDLGEASIRRFGRKELIYPMTESDMTKAETDMQTQMTISAFPEMEPVELDEKKEDGLEVHCVGRVYTMVDTYVSVNSNDGTDLIPISQYINEILAADVDPNIITPAVITANAITTRRIAADGTPARVWNKIEELTNVGDGVLPWRFYIEGKGRARYEPADRTAKYLWTGKGVTTVAGGDVSWEVTPAVIRDAAGRHAIGSGGAAPSSAFIRDGRDMWAKEVTMTVGAKFPKLSPGGYSPNELMQNYRKHLEFIDREGRRLTQQ